MTKNERTSKRIAAIAGRVLGLHGWKDSRVTLWDSRGDFHDFLWRDIRALAASALTQARDKASPVSREPKVSGVSKTVWHLDLTGEKSRKTRSRKARGVKKVEIAPPKARKPRNGEWFAKNHRHREHLARGGK